MNSIDSFAFQRAESAAAKLWAYGSAPFPLLHGAALQAQIEQEVTETAIQFAIHARRILDNRALIGAFQLDEPFRIWEPAGSLKKVSGFREALNRIVHATEFLVGFEALPDGSTRIAGGAVGVIYLRTRTDRKEDALIDVFALAACFFHRVLPALHPTPGPSSGGEAH